MKKYLLFCIIPLLLVFMSMTPEEWKQWATAVAESQGYRLGDQLSVGTFYKKDHIRNMIYRVHTKDGKSAILKLYADFKITDEPIAMQAFEQQNKSTRLINIPLVAMHIESPKKGWFIMEELPLDIERFASPLSAEQIDTFVQVYIEYRKYFPKEPTRELRLSEYLSASEFHTIRIYSWFRLANEQEEARRQQGIPLLLAPHSFVPLYEKALAAIRDAYANKQMIWSHGHVKPQEILYSPSKDLYYLLDFAHTKMYPVGYEQGFIIWADLFMGDWNTAIHNSYDSWRTAISRWEEVLCPTLTVDANSPFWRAIVLERCLGTILADVTASDQLARELQEKKRDYVLRLVEELLA